MKIYIGSDHAGFALKSFLVPKLQEKGYNVIDTGPEKFVEGDDFPITLLPLILALKEGDDTDKGIVIGGSGQGEAMVCNRHKRLRAVVYYGAKPEILRLSHEHNNANILSLGARFLTEQEALDAVVMWLSDSIPVDHKYVARNKELDVV